MYWWSISKGQATLNHGLQTMIGFQNDWVSSGFLKIFYPILVYNMENRPVIRVQRASEFSRYRPFCCYGIMRILRLNDRMFFPFDQLKARLTAHLSVFFTRKRSLGAANTQIFQADVLHTNLWIDLSATDETSMTPSHLRALTSKTRGWFHRSRVRQSEMLERLQHVAHTVDAGWWFYNVLATSNPSSQKISASSQLIPGIDQQQ